MSLEKFRIEELMPHQRGTTYNFGYRHVVAILILCSTMTAYFGRVNLSTAIVAMVRDEENIVSRNVDKEAADIVETIETNTTTTTTSENHDYTDDDYDGFGSGKLAMGNVTVSVTKPVAVIGNDVCPRKDWEHRAAGSGLAGNRSTKSQTSHWQEAQKFLWDQKTQGVILGAFFYGYFAFQVISGRLAELIGPRFLCSFGLSATGLLNLLIPSVAQYQRWFFASRVVLGACQAAIFPCCYVLVSRWIPDNERSTVNSMMVVGANLGIVIASSTAGYLSQRGFAGGWPSVFYVTGTSAIIISIVYFVMVRDEPVSGWLVSPVELSYIEQNIDRPKRKNPPIPWRRILTNRNVWAGTFTQFTHVWTMNMIVLKLPDYMHHVLRLSLQRNGMFTSAIYICEAFSLFLNGMLADSLIQKKTFNKPTVRKIFQTISSLGSGLCLVSVPFTGCNEHHFLIVMIICMLLIGVQSGGLTSLPSDLTTEFSATIFAIFNTFASMNGFLCPYVIGYMMDHDTGHRKHQWSLVMYGTGGMKILGGLVFLAFVTAKRQDWDTVATTTTTTTTATTAGTSGSRLESATGTEVTKSAIITTTTTGSSNNGSQSMVQSIGKRQLPIEDPDQSSS